MRTRLLPWRDWRLRSKLTLALLLLALTPLTTATVYNSAAEQAELIQAANAHNRYHARGTAQALDSYLAERLSDLRVLGMSPLAVGLLQRPQDAAARLNANLVLVQIHRTYGYDALFLVNQLGQVLAANDDRWIGCDYFLAPFFHSAVAGQVSLDGPRYDPHDGQVFLYISAPVQAAEGSIVGAAIARITMDPLDQIIARDTNATAPGAFGVLWDEQGICLSHARLPELRFTPLAPLPADAMVAMTDQERFGPETASLLSNAGPWQDVIARSRLLLYDAGADPHLRIAAGSLGRLRGALAPLNNARWTYGVFTPEASVLAPVQAATKRSVLTAIYAGVSALVVALAMARWLARPLSTMTVTARAIADGDLDQRVGLRQNDELGQLAAAFDAMVDAVGQRDAELQAQAQHLETAVRELHDEIARRERAEEELRQHALHVEAMARLLEALAAAGLDYQAVLDAVARHVSAAMDGICVVAMLSDDRQWLHPVAFYHPDPEALAFARAVLADGSLRPGQGPAGRVVQSGQPLLVPVLDQEQMQQMRAGTKPEFWPWYDRYGMHSLLIVPMQAEGQVIGTLGVSRIAPGKPYTLADQHWLQDIADRAALTIRAARLHADALKYAADLEAANKELEAFSYSVSHDLRAPLRAIDGFSRILLQEHAPSLPPDVQRYLGIVSRNAQHMDQLITDLLAFSRLARQPLNKETVDPPSLVRAALEDLRAEQEGRRVEILIGDLPPCQADPTLLRQVFANLLSNALKFTRKRDVARIEIGCQRIAGENVYYVRDNGVGFDMRYADKLFGVFQRLHLAEEYEGTGVGLAIVQRIIQRHGGRVWAQAEVDKGATFYFVLAG